MGRVKLSRRTHPASQPQNRALLTALPRVASCAIKAKWEAGKWFLLPRKEKYYPWRQDHQVLYAQARAIHLRVLLLKGIV